MDNYNTTADQGRELSWDDEIQQESSWILLPDGDYKFTVEKIDRARHNGSAKVPPCPKAIVSLRVFDGKGNSVLITENLFLHTSMEWKLSEFFASIGMKQKGEKARMNWNEVYGKSGVCHVEIHNYKKPNDKEGEKTGRKNQINKLYPTYDQPQITTASQPTQNSWKPGNF